MITTPCTATSMATKFITVSLRLRLVDGGPNEPQALQPVIFYVYDDSDDQVSTIVQLKGEQIPSYALDVRPLSDRTFDAERKSRSLVIVGIPYFKKMELCDTITSVPILNNRATCNAVNWAVRVKRRSSTNSMAPTT